jgi:hypothetical protein
MSNAILNAVFERSQSRGVTRLVLLSLADRANDEGRAYCGASDLCKRTNADRTNVFRALSWLRESGEIVVEPDKGPRGCNRYLIPVNQWQNATSGKTLPVAICNIGSGKTPPKPLLTPIDIETGANSDFSDFWKAYPRKVSKTSALKAWRKAKLPPLSELLAALEKQKANWNDMKFIPHPATWLNGCRWEDEVTTATPKQAIPEPRLDVVRYKTPPRVVTS